MVLLREITQLVYRGGVTQFVNKRTAAQKQVGNSGMPPGKQMQVDFTHIRRGRNPLPAFAATLGHSRAA